MSTYLPEELVVKILSRLPPKSLLRFRCVSKTWLDLIGKPDFLSKNILNRSILTDTYNIPNSNGPPPLIVAQAERIDFGGMPIWSFLSYDTLRRASKIRLNLSPLRGHPDYDMLKIIASCNGLLCLYHYNFVTGDVYLWDPTGSSGLRALPPVSHFSQLDSDFVLQPQDVGFGFCQTSKDFRVVRLLELVPITSSDMFTRPRREAEVYSLSDGSCRLLDLRVPCCISTSSQSAALDGMFLWFEEEPEEELCWGPRDEDEDGRRTIIAFDFIDEEFRKIFLPDDNAFLDSDVYGLTLTVINGSIALMGFPRKKKLSLDVWVMLEFGIQESWTKLISIGPSFDWCRPLGFWKNGELFMESRSGRLVLYDPFTQIKKNLHFKGGIKSTLEVVLCMQRPVA